MNRQELLQRIKGVLQAAFGSRLRGVVLYGSEARGQGRPDSDIDLLVLLEGPVDHRNDSRACVDALYDLILELERPIHAKPVDADRYAESDLPLYRAAQGEGILA
jgi:predicted nucleotidyltransferase